MSLRYLPFLLLTLLSTSVTGQDIALVGRILFVTDRDGNPEVYVMDPGGTLQANLTNNAANEQDPAWSPTGYQILFSTDRDGNFEIYIADDDGLNEVNLTSNAASDESPAWSPDGSKIAFQTDRDVQVARRARCSPALGSLRFLRLCGEVFSMPD